MATKKKDNATVTGGFNDNSLVGLTEEEAKVKIAAAGLRCRVRNKDGQGMIGTCDYRLDRINLTIMDGKITSVSRG